jgi:hypothetical protein
MYVRNGDFNMNYVYFFTQITLKLDEEYFISHNLQIPLLILSTTLFYASRNINLIHK